MYAIDGEFGKVRIIHKPFGEVGVKVPFEFLHGGWHKCNEKYRVEYRDGYDGHSLFFSLSAGGVMEMEGIGRLHLTANSVVWVPPGCRHSYFAEKNCIWEFYWLYITEDSLVDFKMIFGKSGVPYFSLKNMEIVRIEFEKMLSQKYLERTEFQVESSGMISRIYHLLLQEYIKRNNKKNRVDTLVLKIIREMEEHFSDRMSLQELSEKYFISVPQLVRRFKNTTQMSPYEYLMTIRIQKAEDLLRYSGNTVEEISRKTGFLSTSNFIAQFRKHRNITPGQYRKGLSGK